MKKGEIVTGAVFAAVSLFMLIHGVDLLGKGRSGEVGSGFWPMISLSACLVLSIIWLIQSIMESKKAEKKVTAPTPEETAETWVQRRTVGLCMLSLLLYIVAMPWIGFVFSTFLFVIAVSLSLGERRKMVLAVSPFLLTGIIVAVFASFIKIPFPRGVGVFASLSRLFYN
ncbi:MAG: tripartite tricarboxylate transporter TctB family protein [Syntrophaceae bacterium]|nr:tripartite tricarboxylate transporter TctB family protein [Syntrophaceae bacterium]